MSSGLVETPHDANNTQANAMDSGNSGNSGNSGATHIVPNMMDVSPGTTNTNYYSFINKKINMAGNGVVLILLFIIILVYYLVFSSMGQPTAMGSVANGTPGYAGSAPSSGMYFSEVLLWALFIFLVMTNALQYFFEVDIQTAITDIFTKEPKIEIDVSKPQSEAVPEITYEKQVYHVPDNKYTYEDAKAVCKAFGSRLATYQEIEKAYNEGAEWCSYGWSEGQMALFPTQESTWKKLQKHPTQKNACGRPGINGGYIDNSNAQFGINCYGYKPQMNNVEQQIMRNQPLVPETQEEREFDQKVNAYKHKLQDILVAPFNRNRWSKI